jgi:hypothetical protein
MERTIKLALNKFDQTPKSLIEGELGRPLQEITVNLTSLYHHYYLDSYGRVPPDPDPAQFEYLRFLLPTADFRLKGDWDWCLHCCAPTQFDCAWAGLLPLVSA